jgi:hypothetical protein
VNSQVWWFVARSSGIVAWALLTLSVCWGLLLSTRVLTRRVSPAWLLDLHRHLGGLAVVFTGIHLVGLVADSYVTFGWAELFIPMASSWKPGAVAFGVVAFYLLLAIEITSLAIRRLPRSLWRWVHRSSFLLFAVATYHGIAAGTDAGNQWYRMATWIAIGVVVTLTLVLLMVARRTRTRLASFPPAVGGSDNGDVPEPIVQPSASLGVAIPPLGAIEPFAPEPSSAPPPPPPPPPARPRRTVETPPQPVGATGSRPSPSPWLPPTGAPVEPTTRRELVTAGRNGGDAGEPPTTAT